MVLVFSVEFGEVEEEEFYPGVTNVEELETEFCERVVKDLDVECSVKNIFSESVTPPYVTIYIDFELSDDKLYEKYGKSGLSEEIQLIAEDVFESESSKVIMEKQY